MLTCSYKKFGDIHLNTSAADQTVSAMTTIWKSLYFVTNFFHLMTWSWSQEPIYRCVGGQLSVSHSNVNMEIKFIAGYGTVHCHESEQDNAWIAWTSRDSMKCVMGWSSWLAYSWRSLKHLWKLLLFQKHYFMDLLESVILHLCLSLQKENWVAWWPTCCAFSHWPIGRVEESSAAATGQFPG